MVVYKRGTVSHDQCQVSKKPSFEEELGFSGHDGDDNALFCRFAAAGIMF